MCLLTTDQDLTPGRRNQWFTMFTFFPVNIKLQLGAYVELVMTQEAEPKINNGIDLSDFVIVVPRLKDT